MDDTTQKVVKNADITLKVGLDKDNIPVDLQWYAEDSPDTPTPQTCKAMLLSLFDKDHKDTLKIDLWTQELQVNEMDKFMYQTLRGLADTYYRATNNKQLANDMQRFAQYFGESTQVVPKAE